MARIRSIKPEFWDDDVIGALSRDARLLFIATWSLADDEGLLRWTPVYLKSQALMYDDDLSLDKVSKLMADLVNAGLVFPYLGGASQQRLAMVVHFHRHQRVNRPQPSKLPPPSLQNPSVRTMYERRDGFVCHICGGEISQAPSQHPVGSVDHVKPRSHGGSDYPSNIRAAHLWCNKRRGASPIETDSLNDSLNHSLTEGKGREGKGEERRGRGGTRATPTQRPRPGQPPPRCPTHINDPAPPPCGACGDARRLHDAWTKRPTPAITAPDCPIHPGEPATNCRACELVAAPPPPGWRKLAAATTPQE